MSSPMKVMKFSASWCQPCKTLSKTLDSIKEDLKLPLEEIDIEEDSDIAVEFGIRSVPTLVKVDENMQPIDTVVGAGTMNAGDLKEFFSA